MLPITKTMLSVVALVLVSLAFAAFYVAFKGKKHSDKLIAINVISTKVTVLIAVFALKTDQFSYVDVALVYAMMSFISTVIIARYMNIRAAQKQEDARKKMNTKEDLQDA